MGKSGVPCRGNLTTSLFLSTIVFATAWDAASGHAGPFGNECSGPSRHSAAPQPLLDTGWAARLPGTQPSNFRKKTVERAGLSRIEPVAEWLHVPPSWVPNGPGGRTCLSGSVAWDNEQRATGLLKERTVSSEVRLCVPRKTPRRREHRAIAEASWLLGRYSMNAESSRCASSESDLDLVSGLGEDKPFVLRALIEEPGHDPARWVMALSLLIQAGSEHRKSHHAAAVRSVRSRVYRRAG